MSHPDEQRHQYPVWTGPHTTYRPCPPIAPPPLNANTRAILTLLRDFTEYALAKSVTP